MSLRELLPRVSKGERLSAAQENMLRDLATRQISGVGVGWDAQGTYLIPAMAAGEGIVGVTLTEDMGETTAGEASGLLQTWDAATEAYVDAETEIVVIDPKGIFADCVAGDDKYARRRQGNGRVVYELLQSGCG